MRIDDARPRAILSASCGLEGARTVALQAAARRGAGGGLARTGSLRDPAAPAARGRPDGRPRSRLERASVASAERRRACRCSPPIRSTSSTRPARPAVRRASYATTAGTPSRSRGAWRTSTTCIPARSSGPPRTSAGSWATPTSSTRRCSWARPPSSTRANPSGTPDAGAFWRVIEQHDVAALFDGADRHPRDPQGRSRSRAAGRARAAVAAQFFLAGGVPTPTRTGSGRAASWKIARWSTTGGRPRPAGPIAASCRGLDPPPLKAGSPSLTRPSLSRRRPRRRRRPGSHGRAGRDRDPAANAAGDSPDLGTTTPAA